MIVEKLKANFESPQSYLKFIGSYTTKLTLCPWQPYNLNFNTLCTTRNKRIEEIGRIEVLKDAQIFDAARALLGVVDPRGYSLVNYLTIYRDATKELSDWLEHDLSQSLSTYTFIMSVELAVWGGEYPIEGAGEIFGYLLNEKTT